MNFFSRYELHNRALESNRKVIDTTYSIKNMKSRKKTMQLIGAAISNLQSKL